MTQRYVRWVCILALLGACASPVQTAGTAPVGQDASDVAGLPHDATAWTDAAVAVDAPADAVPDAEVAGAADTGADAAPGPDTDPAADGTAQDGDTQASDSSGDSADATDASGPDASAPPTTVWVHYPSTEGLTLRGDTAPLSWDGDLAPVEIAGSAARFVLPETTQLIQVKALHKGAWALGNNQVVQPHEQRHLYPYFDAAGAQGKRENYDLPGPDGKSRTLRAFLPPGYAENTLAKYPLLLMMDGQNLFEDETASFGVSWQLDEAVLATMAAAKAGEIVVVGIDHAGPKRIFEYTPWFDKGEGDGGGGEAFLQWVDKSVIPDANSRYRLVDDRDHRVIGGSSLGGLMALYALESRPQVWSGALCMSGAWWWNGLQIATWVQQVWSPLPVRVWLDAGTQGDGLADAQTMKNTLESLGLQVPKTLGFYIDQGANHSETFWKKRVHLALEFFYDAGNQKAPF